MQNPKSAPGFVRRFANRNGVFLLILLVGLAAFEMFNYSSTKEALAEMLGGIAFFSFRWSSLLAFAFCCIDLAGLARLFTPQVGKDEPAEVWYLFGAWLLAAAMNASLTWWGVSVAMSRNTEFPEAVGVSRTTVQAVAPIVIAVLVWVIRILLIASFSSIGDRLLHAQPSTYRPPVQQQNPYTSQPARSPLNSSSPARPVSPVQRPTQMTARPSQPSYHNLISDKDKDK